MAHNAWMVHSMKCSCYTEFCGANKITLQNSKYLWKTLIPGLKLPCNRTFLDRCLSTCCLWKNILSGYTSFDISAEKVREIITKVTFKTNKYLRQRTLIIPDHTLQKIISMYCYQECVTRCEKSNPSLNPFWVHLGEEDHPHLKTLNRFVVRFPFERMLLWKKID